MNIISHKKYKNSIGIYVIRNLVNNKKYIGQSINLYDRCRTHIRDLSKNKDTIHLQRSYNKYGHKSFIFEIICLCDLNSIDDLEKYYIKVWQTNNKIYGYNLSYGGQSGHKHTEETRIKISERLRGHKHSDSFKEKCRKRMLGNVWSKRSRDKASKSRLGHPNYYHGKRIEQLDLNGNYIKTFNCVNDASVFNGKKHSPSSISEVLNGSNKNRKTAYGFKWRFV